MALFKNYLVSFENADSEDMRASRFSQFRKKKKQHRRFYRKNQNIAPARKFTSLMISKAEEN